MEGKSTDPREQSKAKVFIGRWKNPYGLVARARIVALLQTRRNCYHEMRCAAEELQIRGDRPEAGWIDLRGIDLSGLDLHGCHVRADFSYGMFDGANLNNADMLYCGFQRASLRNVRARGALLGAIRATGAVFDGADLQDAILTTAVLNEASFREANLERARLEVARIDRADFRGARVTGARFEQTSLAGALFDLWQETGEKP